MKNESKKIKCPDCNGTGKKSGEKCKKCSVTGKVDLLLD
jgi:DnaJ-class molecular chaperone